MLSHETTIFCLKMMVKSGLEFFILKSYVPLQSCCCPVQKKICPERLNWPGTLAGISKWASLAGISEGARRIAK